MLYRDYLPKDFDEVAKASGVTGVVLVQAGQNLPDNQWNLDITAHNPKLYRGVVGNLSPVIGTDAFKPLFTSLCKDPRYLGYRLSGRYQDGLRNSRHRRSSPSIGPSSIWRSIVSVRSGWSMAATGR